MYSLPGADEAAFIYSFTRFHQSCKVTPSRTPIFSSPRGRSPSLRQAQRLKKLLRKISKLCVLTPSPHLSSSSPSRLAYPHPRPFARPRHLPTYSPSSKPNPSFNTPTPSTRKSTNAPKNSRPSPNPSPSSQTSSATSATWSSSKGRCWIRWSTTSRRLGGR